MVDKKFFDEVTEKFSAYIPESFQQFKVDMEKNLRAVLQSTFTKMDLVTREEFDVHAQVLKKTREKLDKLEQHIHKMEEKVGVKKTKTTKKEE